MIKINLIAERKAPKTRKASSLKVEGLGDHKSLMLSAILLLGIATAGVWWYSLHNEMEHWKEANRKAQAELQRLEDIRKKGEYYKEQKALLERKIQLITELKKKQSVPVHILDQVSRNLPDFLWLEAMSAQNNAISITGKATTYNAVSHFYNNLTSSGYFDDLSLSRASEVPGGVTFNLGCKFKTPEATGSAQSQPAAATPSG